MNGVSRKIPRKIIITNNRIQDNIGTRIIYNLTSFEEFKNEYTNLISSGSSNSIKISLNNINYSNKIILSALINNSNKWYENISLVSQHNISKNIIYYYKDNNLNNPNPRIIFKKSYVTEMSNNNKLLNLSNNIVKYSILDKQFDIVASSKNNIKYAISKNINIILNYYSNFNSSNYYQINLQNFYIDKSGDKTIKSIDLQDFSVNNNFSLNNNLNIDISTLSTIFCISNNNVSKLSSFTNILEASHNLLLFNIPDNLTRFKLKYYNSTSPKQQLSIDSSNSDITFVIKKFKNFTDEHYGKIYLTKDKIYLNTQVYTQDKPYIEPSDNSNHIFLACNNGSTGLTIKNILKHMIFDISKQYINNTQNAYLNRKIYENNINKIYITNKNIQNNYKYDIENFNYLVNNDYNYSHNHINSYKSLKTTLKEETIDFSNIIKDHYKYIYKSRFNDISLIINQPDFSINNNNNLILNEGFNIKYNFRNKYGINFHETNNYILRYDYNQDITNIENIENMNDFSENLLLNFTNINLDTFISTYDVPSDFFKNVDCVFVYNKPGTTDYEYPENNINVINNPPLDTLVKTIELLPNANSNTSNTAFIPFRNSSNMSRKQIYGHIANNNIPKLLSIEPYDKKILIGRGLDGQYSINQECPNEENIVLNKYNSQQHSSVKLQNPTSRNLNFANIMNRNRSLNLNTIACDDISYIRNNVTSKNYKTYISRFHLKK